MATVEELLGAIKRITDCTGDPQAWLTGLTLQEVSEVATVFTASPQRIDALVARLHSQHPDLFDPRTGAVVLPPPHRPGSAPVASPPTDRPPQDRQEGDAADAIRCAEAALAQQNSTTSQLDLQVITAILNAHLKTVDGKDALDKLQHDIESAVRARTDLDTAAGARDFQRYLVGKLKDIRAVIAGASLDDTSKSAMMAALTSLYAASQRSEPEPDVRGAPQAVGAAAPSPGDSWTPDTGVDPYLDAPLADDSDGLTAGIPGQAPAPMPAPAMAAVPTMGAGIPNLGGLAVPGAGLPGWSLPSGPPMPGLAHDTGRHRSAQDDDEALDLDDPTSDDRPSAEHDDEANAEGSSGDSPPQPDALEGPTPVALPNGETVTAASPQLAAAIEAAVTGTPIPDAFRQQGITIPPPGTAVTDPVDPAEVAPGDIGMFTDRHALALGDSQSLVNGQIQHISTVQGPSFLGWEHPPAPAAAPTETKAQPPTPTRPAAVAGTT